MDLIPNDQFIRMGFDDGQPWHHSTFPTPTIIVDWDKDNRPINLVATRKSAERIISALNGALSYPGGSRHNLKRSSR